MEENKLIQIGKLIEHGVEYIEFSLKWYGWGIPITWVASYSYFEYPKNVRKFILSLVLERLREKGHCQKKYRVYERTGIVYFVEKYKFGGLLQGIRPIFKDM